MHIYVYKSRFGLHMPYPTSTCSMNTLMSGCLSLPTRAAKGSSRPRVILILPLIYTRVGLGESKPYEIPHYLGPYPNLEGQGHFKARLIGLKTRKLLFNLIYITTNVSSIDRALSCLTSIVRSQTGI